MFAFGISRNFVSCATTILLVLFYHLVIESEFKILPESLDKDLVAKTSSQIFDTFNDDQAKNFIKQNVIGKILYCVN